MDEASNRSGPTDLWELPDRKMITNDLSDIKHTLFTTYYGRYLCTYFNSVDQNSMIHKVSTIIKNSSILAQRPGCH
jgi:hypothetical protein